MAAFQMDAVDVKGDDASVNFARLARDISTLGGGTLVAAIFGTLMVFLIPRLITVEDYGYWRLFVLYAGYVGFLHIGFPDGALLRWAGKPIIELQQEIVPSLKFLVYQQLVLAVPASLIIRIFFPQRLQFVAIGVLCFALIMNSVTLLQSGLQAARLFKPVALATALPTGLFILLTLLAKLFVILTFRDLIVLYMASWAAVLVFLYIQIPAKFYTRSVSTWRLGKEYTLLGWSILLANGGLSLLQSADRIAVSSALTIYDFAQYSLAASAMFVPVTAITAVYRVFFAHLASVTVEDRSKLYSRASNCILLIWGAMLPYYFGLDLLVRHFLPKYVPSLPVAGILLLGVFFLAEIQILHASFSYLHSMQHQFLICTILALVVCFSLTMALALGAHSLLAVAMGQVTALAFSWFFNEWRLRDITGRKVGDWARVLLVFSSCTFGLAMTCRGAENPLARAVLYYLFTACVLWLGCRTELLLCLRALRFIRSVGINSRASVV